MRSGWSAPVGSLVHVYNPAPLATFAEGNGSEHLPYTPGTVLSASIHFTTNFIGEETGSERLS